MNKELLKDIIEWDTVNWSHGLRYWEEKHPIKDKNFSTLEYTTIGFFGAFGRTEGQRCFLGKTDTFLKPIIPKSMRYIVVGIARK